jgi:EmrB/QacA subfamily drug resistance transporter
MSRDLTDPDLRAVGGSRVRNVALLVAGCFFMELLDGTIVVTAIPRISSSLGITAGAAGLVVTAYLVTVAVLIPLSAWLTLRYGYRRVLLSAIAIFTLASLGCAASQSFGELVAMRVLQAVGGAMMVPVGRMIVFERADKSQVMRLMSFIVWPALIAPVIAPLAGGVITTYADWRWLFLINLPLGVVGLACAWRLIHGRPAETPPRLDRLGVVLTCGGLTALTWGAHLVSDSHPGWPLVAALGLASVVLLVAGARHMLRVSAPLLDLKTLRIPTFANAMLGSSLAWLVIGAIPFLLPLLFQTVFGWSPIKSGALVLFVFVGNIAIKPATSFLYRTYGFRRVLLAATICLSLTAIGCGLLTASTPVVAIALLTLISGAARSVSMTGYTTLALSDVPAPQMRPANALFSTAQQLFTGLAVALATVALRIGHLLGHALGSTDGLRAAYSTAFLAVAIVAGLATAVALCLHPSAGEVLTTDDATARSRTAPSG